MKLNRKRVIHYALLSIALLTVWLTQHIPGWAAWYSQSLYPYISKALSTCSGWVPFSLGDLFITLSITGIILYPIYARIRGKSGKMILRHVVTFLAWIYVWFYLAWGLNYSQPSLYQRTPINYFAYTPEGFEEFLHEYIDTLNSTYIPIKKIDKVETEAEIIRQYRLLDSSYGIHPPQENPRAKTMLFSSQFSKMAITGYMGPFFCEFNLNEELLPTQYADTYAHELSHFLGISSEAEANFYAYLVCSRSTDPHIRFCGYFSAFGHIISNAQRLLPEEVFKGIVDDIRPEILELNKQERSYWMKKYSKTIGSIQDWVYDLYLKGNRIESGRKNYSEVVGLLISWWKWEKERTMP